MRVGVQRTEHVHSNENARHAAVAKQGKDSVIYLPSSNIDRQHREFDHRSKRERRANSRRWRKVKEENQDRRSDAAGADACRGQRLLLSESLKRIP